MTTAIPNSLSDTLTASALCASGHPWEYTQRISDTKVVFVWKEDVLPLLGLLYSSELKASAISYVVAHKMCLEAVRNHLNSEK